jgi:hypothetical protein
MVRRLLVLVTALLLAPFLISACGSDSAPTSEAKPASLNGTWKAEGLEAVIADNRIEINIVDEDTRSLYWKGTFPAGGATVTSAADTEALSASMLGSQDSTKDFTVKDDEITFKMSMLGTTKTIRLKRA